MSIVLFGLTDTLLIPEYIQHGIRLCTLTIIAGLHIGTQTVPTGIVLEPHALARALHNCVIFTNATLITRTHSIDID